MQNDVSDDNDDFDIWHQSDESDVGISEEDLDLDGG